MTEPQISPAEIPIVLKARVFVSVDQYQNREFDFALVAFPTPEHQQAINEQFQELISEAELLAHRNYRKNQHIIRNEESEQRRLIILTDQKEERERVNRVFAFVKENPDTKLGDVAVSLEMTVREVRSAVITLRNEDRIEKTEGGDPEPTYHKWD